VTAGASTLRRGRVAFRLLTVFSFILVGVRVSAQELVQISVPGIVSFDVLSVGLSSVGSPNPTRISFSNASLLPSHALRISVRAEGDLTGSSGPSIPASQVSWTTSNVSNGVAINGGLSTGAYNQIFQSQTGAISGGFDVVWTLAAPGTPLNAGNHQATLRWKLEAVP